MNRRSASTSRRTDAFARGRPAGRRTGAAVLLVVASLALALVGAQPSPAAVSCGTVSEKGPYDHYVSKTGPVPCKRARRLVRRFRVEQRRVQHGDGTLATTYWTVPGFPGWRCGLGSGGGGCRYKQGSTRVMWETR